LHNVRIFLKFLRELLSHEIVKLLLLTLWNEILSFWLAFVVILE